MKKLASIFFAFVLCAINMSAQPPSVQISDEERGKALEELKPYQHKFIVKELKLDKEQEQAFFLVYDKMNEELLNINNETRELERQAMADNEASDTELEAVATALYGQKAKEGAIEQQYYEQFKSILTPRQLVSLKAAERRFTQYLLRHHRRISGRTEREGRKRDRQ